MSEYFHHHIYVLVELDVFKSFLVLVNLLKGQGHIECYLSLSNLLQNLTCNVVISSGYTYCVWLNSTQRVPTHHCTNNTFYYLSYITYLEKDHIVALLMYNRIKWQVILSTKGSEDIYKLDKNLHHQTWGIQGNSS